MKLVIIGGAGFIGINSAYYFLEAGHEVIILDNLSRVGSEYNLRQIQSKYSLQFIKVDIRDYTTLQRSLLSLGHIDGVLLLAGQVAVTSSVLNPREDFEINAFGTLNVLEALRHNHQNPLLIYSSTNKVYGRMDHVKVVEREGRYEYENLQIGVGEDMQLDFYSPYGCSKGTGDQYVHDYSRIFHLPTVVMRQSCIYGHRQFGIEDQGWMAWFTIAIFLGVDITIFGDGKQIRDVLFVEDLVRLYDLCFKNQSKCSGKIYNVGGGPEYTLSLNELVRLLSKKFNKTIRPRTADWRPGDQKVYVSNIQKVYHDLGWEPHTGIEEGLDKMFTWIESNKTTLEHYVFERIKV